MKSFHPLRLTDVCGIFRLLNDLRALRQQPQFWKQPMLSGLCGLTGSQVGISVQSFDSTPTDLTRSVVDVVTCARETQRDHLLPACRRGHPVAFSSRTEIIQLIAEARMRACTKAGDNRPWCISGEVPMTYKDFYLCSFITSYRRFRSPLRHQWLLMLAPSNNRSFQLRHRRMVELFHQELARITPGDVVPCAGAAAMAQLSPRLRQTLDLLGTGMGEKQVAVELGCSCNTVHGYVKELHRRFAVSTRSELLVQLYETRGLAQT